MRPWPRTPERRSASVRCSASADFGKASAVTALTTGRIVQEDRQIGGRVLGRHLKEHLGDPATMVSRVIDDVQQDGATAHRAFLAADEPEANLFLEGCLRLGRRPSAIPAGVCLF